MADLGFNLGLALTGGDVNREGAFMEGFDQGTRIRQRQASTEAALAQAQVRQAEGRLKMQEHAANANLGEALVSVGLPADLASAVVTGRGGDISKLALGLQERDFRGLAADATAAPAERQGALLGLSNGPITAGDVLGPGGELALDVFDPSQGLTVTPTGEAQIRADQALAEDRLASALLDDEKRTNPAAFRSGGVTVNTGSLTDDLLPTGEGTTIIPDDVPIEEAFGAESFVKGGANAISDFLGLGTIAPSEAQANALMRELSARTQIVMRADVPGGRPPVIVQELLARYAEDPRQLFRGDEQAKINLQTTVNSLRRSFGRVQDQLNSPGKKTPTKQQQLEEQLFAFADLIADYEKVLESLNGSATAETALPQGWTVEEVP